MGLGNGLAIDCCPIKGKGPRSPYALHLPEVSEVSIDAPQGSAPVLGSLRVGELGAQGSAMGGPEGSTGVLPQGSEEERVGSKSQGWLRDRAFPEGTGDQGSAEGPQEEPLGSVLGLRPGKEREIAYVLSQPSLTLCSRSFPVAQPRLGDVVPTSQVGC